jgi:hypothetical protein
MIRAYSTNVEDDKCKQNLFGKPKGKRPLRRSRHTWEDNIKMNLKKTGFEGMYWIHMTQD